MEHQLKGDNECLDITINIKGRIYTAKMPEAEIFELTAQFHRDMLRNKCNSSIEWINRREEKKRLRLCYRYIEDLFGEGLCERYFGDDYCNTLEMMKLLQFIADELERERKEREILCKISTLTTERSV